jgi:hypothetical protein
MGSVSGHINYKNNCFFIYDKEMVDFLLRVIIFHRKSPPYKTPSERRYRAKREKTVTESRVIMI